MEDKNKPVTLGVLMIDFNPVVREGLLAILNKDDGIEVIANVPDGYEALQIIRQGRYRGKLVDVVLTETRNGKLDGVQITRTIKDEFPEVAVLKILRSEAHLLRAIWPVQV